MIRLNVGAALFVADLENYRDWLIEGQRDLEIQDWMDPRNFGDAADALVSRAKTLLDGHQGRLGIHGPFYDLPIDAVDSDIRAVVQKRMLQGLDAAEKLGATQMVLHSPYSTWDHNNLDAFPDARDAKVNQVHETLGPIVKRAEDQGVELVLENIQDIDPMDRLRLAQSFGSEAVKVSIDTGHAHYAHGSTGAPPVDYFVRAAGASLAHVHLQDADGYADRHWAPGEGSVNWLAVFTALAEAAPEARLVMELVNPDHVQRGFEYLRDLGVAK